MHVAAPAGPAARPAGVAGPETQPGAAPSPEVGAPPKPDRESGTSARGPEGACSVTLGSRPGSDVWIDGERVGPTPVVARTLGCGKHRVVFRDDEQGLQHEETIVLEPGQLLRRSVDLSKGTASGPIAEACSVTLGSTPWAEIWIDGQKTGTTPVIKRAIACGRHEIVLRNPELQLSWRETVQVKPGEVLKRVVTLDAER
jgi:hypothetical protein